MNTYSALYYPYIHFKDDRWVRLAALYWDKLARIVPDNYIREDSNTVKSLGNFIENVPPQWASPQFSENFVEFVERYARQLSERYSVSLRGRWPETPVSSRPPLPGGPSGTDSRLGYVFYEKMDNKIQAALLNSGIAMPDRQDPRWIGMHPKIASVYMTGLAEQLAGDRGLLPLADNAVDHLAISGCTVERLAQALLEDVHLVERSASDREVETVAASITLQTALPLGIDKVPIDKILAFREKYAAERAQFQNLVSDFVKPREWLKDVRDRTALTHRIQSEHDKVIKPRVADLKEKLNEVGIATIWGSLNVKTVLPAAIGGTIKVLGLTLNPVAAAGAGFALGVIPIVQAKSKEMTETLRKSNVSYLMRAEEELQPHTIMEQIWLGARKFSFGV